MKEQTLYYKIANTINLNKKNKNKKEVKLNNKIIVEIFKNGKNKMVFFKSLYEYFHAKV